MDLYFAGASVGLHIDMQGHGALFRKAPGRNGILWRCGVQCRRRQNDFIGPCCTRSKEQGEYENPDSDHRRSDVKVKGHGFSY